MFPLPFPARTVLERVLGHFYPKTSAYIFYTFDSQETGSSTHTSLVLRQTFINIHSFLSLLKSSYISKSAAVHIWHKQDFLKFVTS